MPGANNPLNIRYNPANDWDGQIGQDGGFAVFDSRRAGLRAGDVNLKNYGRLHGIDTLEGAISRWAPPSDNNPTRNYIDFVSSRTGIIPTDKLDLDDPIVRADILSAMADFENKGNNNVTVAAIRQSQISVPVEDGPQISNRIDQAITAFISPSQQRREYASTQAAARSTQVAPRYRQVAPRYRQVASRPTPVSTSDLMSDFGAGATYREQALVEAGVGNIPEPEEPLVLSPSNYRDSFRRGLGSGLQGIRSDVNYLQAIGNLFIGDDEGATAAVERARLNKEQAGEITAGSETFEEFLDEPTFSGFMHQVFQTVGMVTPFAAETISTAFIGGVGGAGIKLGLNASQRKIAKKIVKDTVEKFQSSTKDLTLGALTKAERGLLNDLYSNQLIARQSLGRGVGKYGKRGGVTGAFAGEYPIMTGEHFGEFDEAGVDLNISRALQAMGMGIPSAAVGVAGESMLVSRIGRNLSKVAVKRAAGDTSGLLATLAKNIGGGAGRQAFTEMSTETIQEGMLVSQRMATDKEYAKQDALMRLGHSAFAGAIAGGFTGGTGGVLTSIPAVFRSGRDTVGNVKDGVMARIGAARQQQVDAEVDAEQYGTDGYTSAPEAQRDIDAQKRSVEKGVKPAFWQEDSTNENNLLDREIYRDSKSGLYYAHIEGRGTLWSKNEATIKNFVRDYEAEVGNAESVLAAALGYSAAKPDIANRVVQIRDKNTGDIISEELTDDAGFTAAIEAAYRIAQQDDTLEIVETTLKQALIERNQRVKAEEEVITREMQLEENLYQSIVALAAERYKTLINEGKTEEEATQASRDLLAARGLTGNDLENAVYYSKNEAALAKAIEAGKPLKGKKTVEEGTPTAPSPDTVIYSDGEITWTFGATDNGDGTYTVFEDNDTTGSHGMNQPTRNRDNRVKAGSVSEAINIFYERTIKDTQNSRQRNKDRLAKVKKERPDLLPELEANIKMQDRLIKMLEGTTIDRARSRLDEPTEADIDKMTARFQELDRERKSTNNWLGRSDEEAYQKRLEHQALKEELDRIEDRQLLSWRLDENPDTRVESVDIEFTPEEIAAGVDEAAREAGEALTSEQTEFIPEEAELSEEAEKKLNKPSTVLQKRKEREKNWVNENDSTKTLRAKFEQIWNEGNPIDWFNDKRGDISDAALRKAIALVEKYKLDPFSVSIVEAKIPGTETMGYKVSIQTSPDIKLYQDERGNKLPLLMFLAMEMNRAAKIYGTRGSPKDLRFKKVQVVFPDGTTKAVNIADLVAAGKRMNQTDFGQQFEQGGAIKSAAAGFVTIMSHLIANNYKIQLLNGTPISTLIAGIGALQPTEVKKYSTRTGKKIPYTDRTLFEIDKAAKDISVTKDGSVTLFQVLEELSVANRVQVYEAERVTITYKKGGKTIVFYDGLAVDENGNDLVNPQEVWAFIKTKQEELKKQEGRRGTVKRKPALPSETAEARIDDRDRLIDKMERGDEPLTPQEKVTLNVYLKETNEELRLVSEGTEQRIPVYEIVNEIRGVRAEGDAMYDFLAGYSDLLATSENLQLEESDLTGQPVTTTDKLQKSEKIQTSRTGAFNFTRFVESTLRRLKIDLGPISIVRISEYFNLDPRALREKVQAQFPQASEYVIDKTIEKINELQNDPNAKGRYLNQLSLGHLILVDDIGSTNPVELQLTVAHEMGHAFFQNMLQDATNNPKLNEALLKAWEAARDAPNAPDAWQGFDVKSLGFEEWVADNFGRWAVIAEAKNKRGFTEAAWAAAQKGKLKPENQVDSFFARYANKFVEMWTALSTDLRRRFGKNESSEIFSDYLEEVINKYKADAITAPKFQQKVLVRNISQAIEGDKVAFSARVLQTRTKLLERVAEWPVVGNIFGLVRTADGMLRRLKGNTIKNAGRLIADMFEVSAQTMNPKLGMFRSIEAKMTGFKIQVTEILGDDPQSSENVAALEEAFSDTKTADLNSDKAKAVRQLLEDTYDNYIVPANTKIKKRSNYFPIVLNLEAIAQDPEAFIQLILANQPIDPKQQVDAALRAAINGVKPEDFNAARLSGKMTLSWDEYSDAWNSTTQQHRDEVTYGKRHSRGAGQVANEDAIRTAVAGLVAQSNGVMEENVDPRADLDGVDPQAGVEKAIKLTLDIARNDLRPWVLDPDLALEKYLRSLAYRVEWNRHTKDAKGVDKLEPLLNDLNDEDRVVANEIINSYLGYNRPMDSSLKKLSSWMQVINAVAFLPFTVFASLSDLAGPLINSKEFGTNWNTFGNAFHEIMATWNGDNTKLAMDINVASAHAATNSWFTQTDSMYMDPTAKLWNERYFKWTGLEWFTRFSRQFASGMGKAFILAHAHNIDNNPRSTRYLAQLGLTANEVLAWEGDLKSKGGHDFTTPEGQKVKLALQRFVESSILRPNAAQRPLWANDPRFALIWQLKSFFYAFHKTTINGIINEMKARDKEAGGIGNPINRAALPLLVLTAIATMPLAMVGLELREYTKAGLSFVLPGTRGFADKEAALRYRRSNQMGAWEYTEDIFDRAGFYGIFSIFNGAHRASGWGQSGLASILGPTAETVDAILRNGVRIDDTFNQRINPFGVHL